MPRGVVDLEGLKSREAEALRGLPPPAALQVLELRRGLDQVGSDGRVRPPEEWHEEATLEAAIANPPPGQDTARHAR